MPGILRFQKILFEYFKKGISKKTSPGILRFAGMLFLIFNKWNKQKVVPGYLSVFIFEY